MTSFKMLNNLAGWLVFAIAALVLGAAAQPTGSLWDCGEFIAGAYKLQVVHPPGAPIFLIVGRLFAWIASMVSSDPATIAYGVNLLSALSTAFAALFICWSTTILARLALTGRDAEPTQGEAVAIVGSGVVAGLTTAFCSSVWFSAVEGEVYAMSTFFTCMTLWATLKWYQLPDNAEADRWLVFAIYSTALSIGVHLLSLLTFPALAMFYYFKKSKKPTVTGTAVAAVIGVVFIVVIQSLIIAGIPRLWAFFEKIMVNGMGLPFHTGIIPVLTMFGVALWLGLRYAERKGNGLLQRLIVALGVVVIAYLSYGMVVIRANANTPINMNDPSDAMRLLPYLNREQYGERPLLRGPHFDIKQSDITDVKSEERYGRVGNRYEIVDEKVDYVYSPRVQTLFPRMTDATQGRPQLYRQWLDKPKGTPTFGDQIEFFFKYQWTWMYWRYFKWNFVGRQNGEQGYYAWDPTSGNWISGLSFIDNPRIGDQTLLPDYQKNNQARNVYFGIPLLLGLLGIVFHLMRRPRDFAAIMALFIITGIGIIVYSNQPPNEPRERDYVLAGSFFTFAIWVGMAVTAIFAVLRDYAKLNAPVAAGLSTLLALSSPVLMVSQNWDDHSRAKQFASRDYARNFLESCAPNAIVFTYGDNDTYPLWYCQEVENLRTDVRVVNLSLIAVDWYINQLRRKVNDSPAIKMTIPEEKIRGFKRLQNMFYAPGGEKPMSLGEVVKFLAEDHPLPTQEGRSFETYLPTRNIFIPVNRADIKPEQFFASTDTVQIADTIQMNLGKTNYILKDQLAIMDIIASNLWERPIYWAVTCQEDKLMGLEDYLQLEGLALRLVPVKTENSVRAYGSIIGGGRVSTDIAFKNITEKWRWGNFDKERQFIDKSYMPSLQTMGISMIRIGRDMAAKGQNDKAIALADKYFEAFPDFNFPPNQFTAYMADLYARAGAKDKAAAKVREIAKTAEQQMRFVQSLSPDFQQKYQQDFGMAAGMAQTLMEIADYMQDGSLRKELEDKFNALMPEMPALPGVRQ